LKNQSAVRTDDADLDQILDLHAHDSGRLLQILREIQELRGCIDPSTVSIYPPARYSTTNRGCHRSIPSFIAAAREYRVLFSDNITDVCWATSRCWSDVSSALVATGQVSEDGLSALTPRPVPACAIRAGHAGQWPRVTG